MKIEFYHITNPVWHKVYITNWFYVFWKRLLCSRGVHLFDEILTDSITEYLICDGCRLAVINYSILQPDETEKFVNDK
jgi:hypothetical protein